jgi:ferredoxin-NADP reductase
LERLTCPPPRAPGRWQAATIVEIRAETPRARTFRLELPLWVPHLPGQHYDVRLTAPDGYQAQRSYSVASSPQDQGRVELTIDRLDEGEVSTWFHDVAEVGDEVELRGPFGGWFVWRGDGPALLVGGGSGVVPLMAMLRHRRRTTPGTPMRLVYSVRTPEDVLYADELGDDVVLTFTRRAPAGWEGHTGRVTPALIRAAGIEPGAAVFVCGSNAFVEAAIDAVLAAGFPASAVRAERFGPTS